MKLRLGVQMRMKTAMTGVLLLFRYMRQRGLKTAHYGKYHHPVEKEITIPYHKKFLEFDEFLGFEAELGCQGNDEIPTPMTSPGAYKSVPQGLSLSLKRRRAL